MPRGRKPTKKDLEVSYTPEPEMQYREPRSSGPATLLVVLLIVISFVAGYLFFKVKTLEQTGTTATTTTPQNQTGKPTATVTLDQVKKLFANGFIHFGNTNSKLLIVEITDPSCPYCHLAGGLDPQLAKQDGPQFQYATDGGSYDPPVTELRKLVDSGKASLAFLYAPGHGNGALGMQALYCAFDQGKFWEAHDKLMSDAGYTLLNTTLQNDPKNIPQLVDFLSGAVDTNALTACLQSGKYAKALTRDTNLAPTLGYQGTPHFLLNTTMFPGAVDYSSMAPVVAAALK